MQLNTLKHEYDALVKEYCQPLLYKFKKQDIGIPNPLSPKFTTLTPKSTYQLKAAKNVESH